MESHSFSKQMRKATREIHSVSDSLVNAKLFFALTDNAVWGEGLLVFYEIFRYLEEAMREERNSNLGQLLLEGLERTAALEKDLVFYLGDDWKVNYEIRDEVAEYLIHLKRLRNEDPDLLLAYVYHLYMGLLSGGQILTRKRQIKTRIFSSNNSNDGFEITNFDNTTVYLLKKTMRERVDGIAESFSEDKRARLIEESKMVFELNNKIIRTVRGTGRIVLEKVVYLIILIMVIYYIYRKALS